MRGIRNVHLELEGIYFEASPGRLTLALPVEIWEYIRLFSPVSYEFADLSDDALYKKANDDAVARGQSEFLHETRPLLECIDSRFEIYKKIRAKQQKMREELQEKLGGNPGTGWDANYE